jgi:hypothetical protein
MDSKIDKIQIADNEIYQIAKKITSSKNDKKNSLLEKLIEKISESFEKNEEKTDLALQYAIENNEKEVLDLLLDEVNYEIENTMYETSKGIYDSIMLLMPIVIKSNYKNVQIPSINELEEKIREELFQANIIKNKNSFKLGSELVSQEVISNFKLIDFWKLHRNTISESKNNTEIKKLRNQKNVQTKDYISIFYVAFVANQKSSSNEITQDLENILNLDFTEEIWEKISSDLSINDLTIKIIPPESVQNVVNNTSVLEEDEQFESFFHKYIHSEEIDIGFFKLKNNDSDFVVAFFDNESFILENFYVYEKEDFDDFFISLTKLLIKYPEKNLYQFEDIINNEILLAWRDADEIDISSYIKNSELLSLNDISNLFSLKNHKQKMH